MYVQVIALCENEGCHVTCATDFYMNSIERDPKMFAAAALEVQRRVLGIWLGFSNPMCRGLKEPKLTCFCQAPI